MLDGATGMGVDGAARPYYYPPHPPRRRDRHGARAPRGPHERPRRGPAHALIDDPALVQQIHLEYAEAGAQVLTTNTFRTHARSLAAGGLADRAAELTTLAVHLACAARDAFSRAQPDGAGIRVAGWISPLEDCFRPADSPGARAGAEHRVIARQLVDAGADLLLIETMARVDEARAAVAAAQGLGRPIWLAVVARAVGRMLAGSRSPTVSLPSPTSSCRPCSSTAPSSSTSASPSPRRRRRSAPRPVARRCPHTGHHDPERGWQTHAVGPEDFAAQLAEHAAALPAISIFGACCGSTPAWISALPPAASSPGPRTEPAASPASPLAHRERSSRKARRARVMARSRAVETGTIARRPRHDAASRRRAI